MSMSMKSEQCGVFMMAQTLQLLMDSQKLLGGNAGGACPFIQKIVLKNLLNPTDETTSESETLRAILSVSSSFIAFCQKPQDIMHIVDAYTKITAFQNPTTLGLGMNEIKNYVRISTFAPEVD